MSKIHAAMEDQLQELNDKWQAYDSNSLVGNHVNACLKVKSLLLNLILVLNKFVSYVGIVNINHCLFFFTSDTKHPKALSQRCRSY